MPALHVPHLGTIHYHEYGSGRSLLFAFHGYGMTGKQFQVLEKSVLPHYRVIGFDHFFHGGSKPAGTEEKRILSGMEKEDVKQYIDAFFTAQGHRERFSLLGYSIGANFVLTLTEFFAAEIDRIILMAPDGLVPHRGFRFLRQHFFGKRLFRRLTYSKTLATSGLNALKRFRLLDDSLHKIAYAEIDTPQKRLDVYFTLNFIRHISPDMQTVAAAINKYGIRVLLIFGKHDALFPKSNANEFLASVPVAEVHEVPLGHWLVTRELDDYLAEKME